MAVDHVADVVMTELELTQLTKYGWDLCRK